MLVTGGNGSMWMVMAAALSVATGVVEQPEPVRRPSPVRWQVDGGETYCSVIRGATDPSQPQLILRYVALGLSGDMLVSGVSLREHERQRPYTLLVDGDALPPIMGQVQTLRNGNRLLLLRRFDTQTLERVQAARRIEVRRGDESILASAMAMPAGILPLLDECRRDARHDAGIGDDVVVVSDVPLSENAPQPVGSPGRWLQPGDYPRSALLDEAGGQVGVALIAAPTGEIERCIVAVSSGRQDLDDATCGAIMRRGRFRAFDGPRRMHRLWFSWIIEQ